MRRLWPKHARNNVCQFLQWLWLIEDQVDAHLERFPPCVRTAKCGQQNGSHSCVTPANFAQQIEATPLEGITQFEVGHNQCILLLGDEALCLIHVLRHGHFITERMKVGRDHVEQLDLVVDEEQSGHARDKCKRVTTSFINGKRF